MAKIETGVDRLVELINKEKKISVDDAAKKLGISKVVIQEWADFLEEEKIISIEYAFSKTFLVERKLSKIEVKEKEKEYSNEKDAFVRKVETGLKNLEQDTTGFENIKNDFENIKKGIGGELEKVRNEVKELEKYEYLKKNLDKEIEQQVAEFHELLDKSHKEVGFEEKKHQALIEELDIEKREVELKEHRLVGLEEKEKELMNRIQALIGLSKDVQKNVSAEQESIVKTEKRVKELEKSAKIIEENVKKKRVELQPLLDSAKKHEEHILQLQEEILNKAKEKTTSIKNKVEEGSRAVSGFEKFFTKKNEVESFINEIGEEKKDLIESFKLLEKKALAFDLATKSNTVTTHVKELEKDLDKLNSKKSKFKENLEKLIKLIKG
jgi:hypothetical protein